MRQAGRRFEGRGLADAIAEQPPRVLEQLLARPLFKLAQRHAVFAAQRDAVGEPVRQLLRTPLTMPPVSSVSSRRKSTHVIS